MDDILYLEIVGEGIALSLALNLYYIRAARESPRIQHPSGQPGGWEAATDFASSTAFASFPRMPTNMVLLRWCCAIEWGGGWFIIRSCDPLFFEAHVASRGLNRCRDSRPASPALLHGGLDIFLPGVAHCSG